MDNFLKLIHAKEVIQTNNLSFRYFPIGSQVCLVAYENEGHVLHVCVSSALVQPIGDVTERGTIGDVEHQKNSGTVSEVWSGQGPDSDLVRLIIHK